MTTSEKSRVRRGAEEMEDWFRRREQEQLTWKALAQLSGISLPTLQYWRQKLRGKPNQKRASFVEVSATAMGSKDASSYQLRLRSGREITVSKGFEPEVLSELVVLLESC